MEAAPTASPPLNLPWWALPVMVALAILVNLGSLDSFFLADDFTTISTVSREGITGLWCRAPSLYFRPLISASLWLEHRIWGLEALGYHLGNVVAHGLNAFLLASILAHLLGRTLPRLTAPRLTAATAGLLWLLLPSRNESVVWIVGRVDTYAAPFFLLSLLAWLRSDGGRRLPGLILSLVCFLAALLAKEICITLPAVVFLCAWLPPTPAAGRVRRLLRALDRVLPFAAVIAIYLAIRWVCLEGLFGHPLAQGSLIVQPGQLAANLWSHTVRALLPHSPQPGLLHLAGGVLIAALPAAWLHSLLRKRDGRGLLALLGCSYLLCLAPVTTLSVSLTTVAGERFLYFPSMFLVCLLVLALRLLLGSGRPAALLALAAMLACAGLKIDADSEWRRAGDLSRQLVTDLTTGERGRHLLLLAVPGYLDDIMVFNAPAYDRAVRLFDRRARGVIVPLGWLTLKGTAGGIRAERSGDRITLTTSGADIRFHTILDFCRQTALYKVTDFRSNGFGVDLLQPLGDTTVCYYSAGRYHRLPPPAAPSSQRETSR